MNKGRRKRLEEARALIQQAREILEECKYEEQEYMDNMPENMQGSDKYQTAETSVSEMEEAIDCLDSADSGIDAATAE